MRWPWQKQTPPTPTATTYAADPFAAVPVKPDDVELRRDGQGRIHLRLLPALTGLRKRLADMLGYDYSRRLELDEYGSLFYGLVDGRTPLRVIADRLAEQSGRSRSDVEQGVILFTRKLMVMNLLALQVRRVTPLTDLPPAGGGPRRKPASGRARTR